MISFFEPAVREAASRMREALGDISDLPTDMQNIIANVYYAHTLRLMNLSPQKVPRDLLLRYDCDAVAATKHYGDEIGFLVSSIEGMPDMIRHYRDVVKCGIKAEIKDAELMFACLFKYRIPNAPYKSVFRLRLELALRRRKNDDIPGLVDMMRVYDE